jgi:hypothetical protein
MSMWKIFRKGARLYLLLIAGPEIFREVIWTFDGPY